MKATTSARASLKSASATVFPSVFGNRKSVAAVPSASIVEGVKAMRRFFPALPFCPVFASETAAPYSRAMPAYEDLRGQTVVITGGANGIGAAMVRAFHNQQARVFFCDRDVKAGDLLAHELGADVTFTRAD